MISTVRKSLSSLTNCSSIIYILDVLEQFNQPHPSTTKPPPASTTRTAPASTVSEPPRARTSADVVPESDLMSDDFAKELADGMANLMREIASGSEPSLGEKCKDTGGNPEPNEEQQRTMKAAWEAMLIEGLGESGDEDKSKDGGGFQETIKKAMDKLKESEDNARSSTSKLSSDGSDDELAELIAKFGKDAGSEEDMTNFLQNMIGQLMSKEILYEPLKELSDSFPPYLARTDLPSDDRKRYEQQLVYVHKILAEFDKPLYKDDDPACSQTIADLMAQMQDYGQPPAEVMGPLPPGLDFSGEKLPDDCVVA
ncbi:Peroxisomal biogenesis factor 19 [Termitomyces sp. J132]|nr:Peroxisomal biogenesis factor 19 [Termitomyces sp. J132]